MKLAFIGIGKVGYAIANTLEKRGHTIFIASDRTGSESVKTALLKNPAFAVKPVQAAINEADAVFLAVPFQACGTVLKDLTFDGKLLVDCTNPVGPGITHALESKRSGAELVQELVPDAKVVKAFNIYGFENFSGASYPEYNVKPVMLIAGNHIDAKKTAEGLIRETGFAVKDTGPLNQSLHLEHMTLLWVKMVRLYGNNPRMAWACLE